MSASAEIAGIEFSLPLAEQLQRKLRISDLVAQIVRDSAVRIDTVEMRLQTTGQKPGGHREVLVMRAGQPFAVGQGFRQWRSVFRNTVLGRQRVPSREQFWTTIGAELFLTG